ncbi:hypothetical protein T439DRAFT_325250 [Meredithblackwellia eburnea MCA 4105]
MASFPPPPHQASSESHLPPSPTTNSTSTSAKTSLSLGERERGQRTSYADEDGIGHSYEDDTSTSLQSYNSYMHKEWVPKWMNNLPDSSSNRNRFLPAAFLVTVLFVVVWSISHPTPPLFKFHNHPYTDNLLREDLGFNLSDHDVPLPPSVARSLSLSDDQCEALFPRLWPQLETRRREQMEEGGITEHMVEVLGDFGARVTYVNGNLYVKKFEPFATRVEAIIASMHDAILASPEPIPDFDLYLRPNDKGYANTAFETVQPRPGKQAWLIPDFGFYSWPEPILTNYKGVVREIERVEREISWEEKSSKVFWRGAFLSAVRDRLRETVRNKPWADIAEIKWKDKGNGSVPLWDHCRNKYLLQTEGFADAYSGRMKFLSNCKSVVITHQLHWDQHFHPAYDTDPNSPNQNLIMLPGTDNMDAWDKLEETYRFLESNPQRAKQIAENSWRTMHWRYLTPAATACYWRKSIKAYASTQLFQPKIGGKDYESFLLMKSLNWDPHKK